jgi:hypothetical protein
MSIREFKCEYVSSSEAGDYVQVMFADNQESDDAYLLIQRQFEFPDHGECYVETSDLDLCGHYVIHNAQLTRNRFRFSIGDGPKKQVTVSFETDDRAYAEAERILRFMIPSLLLA